MKISVAQLIVQFLEEIKVPYLFGLSGHSIFAITDALYGAANVQFIPAMHELSAAYMAAAYAKGTRTLGACTASASGGYESSDGYRLRVQGINSGDCSGSGCLTPSCGKRCVLVARDSPARDV